MVQWLRLHDSNIWCLGSNPGQGRYHMQRGVAKTLKKNKINNHTPVKMAKMKYKSNTKFCQGYGAAETSMH